MFGMMDFGKIAEMLPKLDAFLLAVEQRAARMEAMQEKILKQQDDILSILEAQKEK